MPVGTATQVSIVSACPAERWTYRNSASSENTPVISNPPRSNADRIGTDCSARIVKRGQAIELVQPKAPKAKILSHEFCESSSAIIPAELAHFHAHDGGLARSPSAVSFAGRGDS